MTKLLYIPNGSYVVYNSRRVREHFTECELEYIPEYLGSPEKEIEELLEFSDKYLKQPNDTLYDSWVEANNFHFPLIREEFEIVYE